MKYKLSEIASYLKKDFTGDDVEITGCNTIMDAKDSEISFLSNPKYVKYLETTNAGAVILQKEHATKVSRAIISENPYLDFAKVVSLFAKPQGEFEGISDLSFIHPSAQIDLGVTIYPFVYVGARAHIGENSKLFSGVYIGEDVQIGKNCILYPNVVVMGNCIIGDNVILHPGVVIGADGFGFAQEEEKREKFPQIGKVIIENNVEIGANSTVDRAALGATVVGKGTKIDNQVQIGHNVQIGENSVIVAQVGIAGSTKIGNNVILAGQVGVAGHLTITDNVIIGAKSGISKDIKRSGIYSGVPIMDHRNFLKVCTILPKLPDLKKELSSLKKQVQELKKQLDDKGE